MTHRIKYELNTGEPDYMETPSLEAAQRLAASGAYPKALVQVYVDGEGWKDAT